MQNKTSLWQTVKKLVTFYERKWCLVDTDHNNGKIHDDYEDVDSIPYFAHTKSSKGYTLSNFILRWPKGFKSFKFIWKNGDSLSNEPNATLFTWSWGMVTFVCDWNDKKYHWHANITNVEVCEGRIAVF